MSSEPPPNPISDTFNPAFWERIPITDENINVYLTGVARLRNTQTFTGVNTFTENPLNTDTQPADTDSSNIMPNTSWVQGAIKDTTKTFTGVNTFSQNPLNIASQPASNDSSSIIPNTSWVQGAILAGGAGSVYNYPQVWYNGGVYRTGAPVPFPVPAVSVFINAPYIDYVPTFPISTTTSYAFVLEITYNIQANQGTGSSTPITIYNGYCLVNIQVNPYEDAVGIPSTGIAYTMLNVGNMFSTQTISNGAGGTNTGFTPVSFDYTTQANKNGLQLNFGAGSLSDGTTIGYSRSVRIVSAYPNGNVGGTSMTIPNTNGSRYSTYITPIA
jgi:hypothetical protein